MTDEICGKISRIHIYSVISAIIGKKMKIEDETVSRFID